MEKCKYKFLVLFSSLEMSPSPHRDSTFKAVTTTPFLTVQTLNNDPKSNLQLHFSMASEFVILHLDGLTSAFDIIMLIAKYIQYTVFHINNRNVLLAESYKYPIITGFA